MVTGLGAGKVDTCHSAELAQREIESTDCSHFAVEETEIDIYITPNRCSEHQTTANIGLKVFECLCTAAVGLVHVVALYTLALCRTVEELLYLVGYRGKLAVAGKLVTQAQVCVCTDIYTYYGRLEVDVCELATQIFVGLSYVEMPFYFVEFFALFFHCYLKVERNFDTTDIHTIFALGLILCLLRLGSNVNLAAFALAFRSLFAGVARKVGKTTLDIGNKSLAFGIQFLQFACNAIHFGF